MDDISLNLDSETLLGDQGAGRKKKQKKDEDSFFKKHKKALIAAGCVLAVAGIVVAVFFIFFYHPDASGGEDTDKRAAEKHYSKLSGEEIADEAENDKPLFCMQIPNGMDVGDPRVQVGLHQAKVVFEAIAEAGITRFAAVFQNPQGSMLGPIRSMRSYYLAWDTPFDCTLVHAGGSADALQTIQDGKYRDLSEDYNYMWRDDSAYVAPNNLFTSPKLLNQFNNDYSYGSSKFAAFARLKPEEAQKEAEKLASQEEAKKNPEEAGQPEGVNKAESDKTDTAEAEITPVNNITVRFGGNAYYNPVYHYDAGVNKYTRGWEYGATHTSYDCTGGLDQPAPRSQCTEVQLMPSVVAVMKVDQWLDTDGYHQAMEVTGSGEAYVFQNGTVIEGTWSKSDISSQIEFKDKQGEVIKLAPGQLWIEAVPNAGGAVVY